jgi:Fic family protein
VKASKASSRAPNAPRASFGRCGPYFETRVDFIFPRPEDVAELMGAWMAMTQRLLAAPVDAVSSAAVIAFAFIFIHPFWDGNGRLHRFMIHHVLAKKGFSPPGMIFPVSAAIARDQHLYNTVLDSFSQSRLPWIDWRFERRGELNEVVVNNDTRRLYSFFDATACLRHWQRLERQPSMNKNSGV